MENKNKQFLETQKPEWIQKHHISNEEVFEWDDDE